MKLPSSVLVIGFARTGQAVADTLSKQGVQVVATDDAASAQRAASAARCGIELVTTPSAAQLGSLARSAELIVVSPGVAPTHPIFHVDGGEIVSEIELAYRMATMPVVAITGTNGKTTVTALVTEMLALSGQRAKALGNIGAPFIEAVEDELDVAVVEVSSFQLALTTSFKPKVATWLNVSEDHLDWHPDYADYVAAKARIWAAQDERDVAVANATDAVVLTEAKKARSRLVTFGADGTYRIVGDRFVGPGDEELASLDDLPRAFPHDAMNALAALATAASFGASPAGCRAALRALAVLPHRIASVGLIDGIEYFDDSKATTPSAVCAALAVFSSVVLIAGGRNKGLDLGAIRHFVEGQPHPIVRGVVAIGEAQDEVAAAFEGYQVVPAASMQEAVSLARGLAEHGDVVLLSPGCASFDWYESYAARGDDFARCVAALRDAAVSSKGRAT